MADYNEESNRLTIKIVYYGPALSGKTTNIMRLHDLIAPQLKGEIMTLETQNDRTLFFDLLPLAFTASTGLLIKFKLFTVPGQVAHDGTRKAVLSRADGVVFVADSQRSQSVNNGESFDNLAENVHRVGLDLDRLPLVVQFNKRDQTNILSEAEISQRWSAASWPIVFASALHGDGVVDTFSQLLAQVHRNLDTEFQLVSKHGIEQRSFVESACATIG
ncbi:cell polarity determinant GTPase MglA [Sulfuriferula plumbiphila]|uniref:Cell polarity determinant GTPase MglA n=1 Tax=Sulfuriferula plumbiphila TaxID=171865 RepID=A0A512L9Y6_9PROT|nr:GTPase domain-containing protein [Sulfuriferula plumbiphila]BBP05213.1 cell polarity determinant GTPase MglA [Sulfuriferula plumbiphila]GEP31298.1 cell polarity determinant GTPase MglA [Sulfuriferula plumbiphila]